MRYLNSLIWRNIVNLMSTHSMPKLPPVVVVLGSTATGKSKLAVDLALKYGGEIISADSMQVYKDLDILTNKVTEEEMKGVPHHMIDVVDRKDKFDVVHFRDLALPLVNRILNDGKIPFIVGGTNYYIESLLWETLIEDKKDSKKEDNGVDETGNSLDLGTGNAVLEFFESRKGRVEDTDIADYDSQELYDALKVVDPERAERLHPNDRRKTIRSLQVRFRTGRKHSELIAEQCGPLMGEEQSMEPRDLNVTKALAGILRFPTNSLCLWIQSDKDVLEKRINDRVENMINIGLRQELDSFMDTLRADNGNLDYERGILQSIGFKEFHSYLQLLPNERDTEEGSKRFQEGTERLKIVTRQYARRQLKWINHRFTNVNRRQVPPVYKLDGNLLGEEHWNTNILCPATTIIDAYFQDQLDDSQIKERLVIRTPDTQDDLLARVCEVCDNRVLIGKSQWEAHLSSVGHNRKRKLSPPEPKGEDVKLEKVKTPAVSAT